MRVSQGWLARAAIGFAAAGGLLSSATSAFATDCGSLQAALTAAHPGDTVTLDEGAVCSGPFSLPSVPITLEGAGAGATIQGASGVRALSGVDVGGTTISNLTFKNGGGVGGGGAVLITGTSTPTFSGDTFLANAASGGPGGGLYVDTTAAAGSVVITDSSFGDGTSANTNQASAGGGGLAITAGVAVAIANSTLSDNQTSDVGGGGAYVQLLGGARLSVAGSSFSGNTAGGHAADLGGGGLRVEESAGSTATVTTSSFTNNALAPDSSGTSAGGGGAYFTYPSLTTPPTATFARNSFTGNVISGGSPTQFSPRGGGLALTQVVLTSTSDRFIGNSIPPGIANYAFGAGLALGTCVTSGVPPQDKVVQAVIAGNAFTGLGYGAGLYSGCPPLPFAATSLKLLQSTVAGNVATSATGGIGGGDNATLALQNSIIGPDKGQNEIVGFASRDITYTDICMGGSPPLGDGNLCADPRLADPAAGDVYESAGSPTVDQGLNSLADGLSTDYLGSPRIVDSDQDGTATVDMGAQERGTTVQCDRLAAEFKLALPGASIRLAGGQTCTGSYLLPPVPINLIGTGSGVTFQPATGRALYGKDVGSSTFRNLTFRGGSGSPGGAVFLEGSSTPTFDSTTFLDNHSSDVGGGLALFSTSGSGTTTLINVHFGDGDASSGNSGSRGGGAAIYPGPTSLFITKSSFESNTAGDGAGGGLYLARGTGNVSFENVEFKQNLVLPSGGIDGEGGGAFIGAPPLNTTMRLAGMSFVGNEIGAGSGTLRGAGLSVVGTGLSDGLEQGNNRFTGNTFLDASTAARTVGAGESVADATLVSHEDRYIKNSIPVHVAGTADGVGLALNCQPAVFQGGHSLTNDVFSHNSATGDAHGAAVYVACGGDPVDLQIHDSTIAANSADDAAGVWGAPQATLTITNSIMWANASSDVTGFSSSAPTYSDICNGTAAAAGTGNICADPKFVDLTNDDVHETVSSPTIDVGSNALVPAGLRIDYEGHERIIDSDRNGSVVVDMGADEQQPPTPTPPRGGGGGPVDIPQLPDQGQGATPSQDQPEQIVADVKVSGGTKKPAAKPKATKCGDRTGPTSRFLNRLASTAKFKGLETLIIRGEARYKKCKSQKNAGKIKRVNFTIKLVQGKQCRFLTKKGTLGPLMSCRRKATLFRAKGTTKWRYTIHGPLPAGKYLAQVQAVDNLGNEERSSTHRNHRHFRINGTQLKQGWNGTHPDDYTKRG